ncbi:hypothetical protein KKA47_03860 [bacterium]|nr:hypothetical protein [bacterium]MCG2690580.1 hypothetical protein [Candidatus Parcubacteria bacterium]
MKSSKTTYLFLVALFFSFMSGCSSNNASTTSPVQGTNLSIDEMLNCSGNALGSDFSGTYEIATSKSTFIGNCPADIVKQADFFVNLALSEEEIAEIIENGYPSSSGSLSIVQTDGTIIFKNVGDDENDIDGCVYTDGSFVVAHSYGYEDEDNYYVSIHQGTITGSHITSEFQSTLKAASTIDCTFQFTYEGDK